MFKLLCVVGTVSVALGASAKVHYLSGNSGVVPEGEITALEVRAAAGRARPGNAGVSGWMIKWGNTELRLTFDFRGYVDGISEPYATLSCGDGPAEKVRNLNFAGGFNTVEVVWSRSGEATISAGEHNLRRVMKLDVLPLPSDTLSVYPIGAGGIDIQDFMIETNSDSFSRLATGHSASELAAARKFRYLDRDGDPMLAVPGGQYELALLGDELVYVGGAKTNRTEWRPGMRKGRLTPTGFEGYFKLEWIDATGRRLPGENYAVIDSAQRTLRLFFPELEASMRFAEIMPASPTEMP